MIGRDIFYITLTGIAIFACVLVKNYIDGRELKAQADKNAQIEKRNRLNECYEFDLQYAYESLFNKNRDALDRTIAHEYIDETEKNMRADGYDRAEIEEIRSRGYRKALVVNQT